MDPGKAPHPNPLARRAAAFTVWYLRVVAAVNLLGAVWVSFGANIRRHNAENYFTPYLLTAGFTTGAVALFLAVTMRRRKRAAWILNLVLCGLFLRRARGEHGAAGDPPPRPEL